jgi:hypothetical protein
MAFYLQGFPIGHQRKLTPHRPQKKLHLGEAFFIKKSSVKILFCKWLFVIKIQPSFDGFLFARLPHWASA